LVGVPSIGTLAAGGSLVKFCLLALAASTSFVVSSHAGIVVQHDALILVGNPTPGSGGAAVSNVNNPYVTRDGRVGFTGSYTEGRTVTGFVWFDGQIVWKDSDALPIVLGTPETTMGVGDNGEWIYSPSQDGLDSVWLNGASYFKETDPAPDLPGNYLTFCSRPQMNADGTPTWVSGISAVKGGGASFRALYKGLPGGGATKILAGGDVVSGEFIAVATSVGFPYDFSTDGSNYISKVLLSSSAATNDALVANNEIVAREGETAFGGELIQNFGEMKINNLGTFVYSGDTNGGAATDGFLARNDAALLREGDVIAGFTLSGNPSAVGLNDLEQIGAIWGTTVGKILFVMTPSGDGYDAHVLMATGDDVDVNGDGITDGTISDFNASVGTSPGLDLPRQCRVCANVDVLFESGEFAAIVCAGLPTAPGLADLNGDGFVNGADLALILGAWGGVGVADITCDGTVDGADLAIVLGAWTG
jgi:hypothetical protein